MLDLAKDTTTSTYADTGSLSDYIELNGNEIDINFDTLWNNTLGAIFQNGFDFSCWGASTSPEEAMQWGQQDLFPWFREKLDLINVNDSLASLSNKFTVLSNQINSIRGHQLFHKSQSSAGCSKDGNQKKADLCASLDAQLYAISLAVFKDKVVKRVSTTINAVTNFPANEGISMKWKGRTSYDIESYTYTFTAKSSTVSGNATTMPDVGDGGFATLQPQYSTPQNAGFSAIAIIALLALLFGGSFKKKFNKLKIR